MNSGRKRRSPLLFRLIIAVVCFGIILFSGVVGFVLIQEKGAGTTVTETDNYDAIIVLGAQVLPDGTPNVQLAWRLDAATEAYRNKRVPVVVCGAQGKDEPLPEAFAMKKYLIDRGVAEEDILTDPDSFNTKQNLENAKALLKNKPEIKKVLVVTSDYHVPLGSLMFTEAALLYACEEGEIPFAVVSNLALQGYGIYQYKDPGEQALYVRTMAGLRLTNP